MSQYSIKQQNLAGEAHEVSCFYFLTAVRPPRGITFLFYLRQTVAPSAHQPYLY